MPNLNHQLTDLKKYRSRTFENHATYVLKEFLDPWCEKVLRERKLKLDKNINSVAIIIDDRTNNLLGFCVLNNL